MSGAHERLPPQQRRLQSIDEALVAVERALSHAIPAISPRPSEAARLAEVAMRQLKAARVELLALFDERVRVDGVYAERGRA
jgi:hypothetical protein